MSDDLAAFESPKELINGAKESIAELEALCKPIGESNDYEVITNPDPQTGEQVVYIRLAHRLPPKIMRLASSIIKELRLSLDQAFCDAAMELGRKNAKGIYFPFGKSIEELNRTVERNCKNVDKLLIDYCLTFKPYYGSDSDGVLWTMSSLAGTYHRRLIGLRFLDLGAWMDAVFFIVGPMQMFMHKWDGPNNQFEIARLPSGAELHLHKNFVLPLNVVLSEQAHALAGRPLLETLHKFIGITEGIVMGIEAETARILRTRNS